VVELNGITDHAEHEGALACPECRAVEDALDRVAHEVAPGEVIHVGRATVTVIHRDGGGANRPPGDDERARLEEILERLRGLGVQERHWRDEAGATSA
jgi:hypothetical protein